MTAIRIKLENLINSRTGIAFGLALSRVPPQVGYEIARRLGCQVASMKNNPMVRAVRANQWVIHDERPTARELDEMAAAIFQNVARSLYEFWHFSGDSPVAKGMVAFDPSFTSCFERSRETQSGLLIVFPHLSNFDLIGRVTALNGNPLHVLSFPQPMGGYRWQNKLRGMPGLKVTPLSIEALRQASETLRAGGTVVTGIDRPISGPENSKYRPRFFDRPANLPVFHIRLALKLNLPIVVMGSQRTPDGRYLVWTSDPIPMVRHPDLVQETIQNAETILAVSASFIQRTKDQWAMFFPVWPEAMDEMPN
jgi:phosphatidylinositol dimannoside acyltransferase